MQGKNSSGGRKFRKNWSKKSKKKRNKNFDNLLSLLVSNELRIKNQAIKSTSFIIHVFPCSPLLTSPVALSMFWIRCLPRISLCVSFGCRADDNEREDRDRLREERRRMVRFLQHSLSWSGIWERRIDLVVMCLSMDWKFGDRKRFPLFFLNKFLMIISFCVHYFLVFLARERTPTWQEPGTQPWSWSRRLRESCSWTIRWCW